MKAIYFMASRSRTLYLGVTSNLLQRVWEHKTGKFDGFSSKFRCTRLVYYEQFENMAVAIAREKQLKRWRREKKVSLITRMNPAWLDLADEWYHPAPINAGSSTSLRSARNDMVEK